MPVTFLFDPLVTVPENATVPVPLAVTVAGAFLAVQVPFAVNEYTQEFGPMVTEAVAPVGLNPTVGAVPTG